MLKYTINNIKTIAIESLEIDIEFGNLNFLVGQNGSGKTNILSAMNAFANGVRDNKKMIPKITSEIPNYEEIKSKITDPRVDLCSDLSNNEREEVASHFKKIATILNGFDSNFDIPKKEMSFLLEQGSIQTFKNFKNEYTDYGKLILLISNLVKEQYKLGDNYFKKDGEVVRLIITEENISKINNSNQNPNKKEIKELFEILRKIENIYYEKPKTIFIEDFTTQRVLLDVYSLNDLVNKESEKHKDTVLLFKFLSEDIYKDAIKLQNDMSKSDSANINGDISNSKKRLERRINAKIKEIYDKLAIYGYPSFVFDGASLLLNAQNKNVNYYFNENESTNENSSGYKAIFNLILTTFSTITDSKINPQMNYVILADEIDKNIHPLAQINLIDFIKNEIAGKNIAFVVTTHSPFLLVKSDIDRCKIVYRDEVGITKVTDFAMENRASFMSSYLVAASQLLKMSDINSFYTSKLIILNTKNEEIRNEFEKLFNKFVGDKEVIIKTKDDFAKSFTEIDLEIEELRFGTDINSFKRIEECLIEYKRVSIDEEDISSIIDQNQYS
jgi:predicted ATP-binding protein involved in virulence